MSFVSQPAVVSVVAIVLKTQLQAIPLELLQIVIGLLLLWFGFGWVKKSVWRQVEGKRAGWISEPLTSEGIVLETENTGFNFLNFILMTKSAALEALEVAIIVITLGLASSAWNESLSGAALALLLTTAVVTLLHGQLLQVPENLIKLSAGIVLIAFGTFWIGEGLGFKWVFGELMLLILITFYGLISFLVIRWLQTKQTT